MVPRRMHMSKYPHSKFVPSFVLLKSGSPAQNNSEHRIYEVSVHRVVHEEFWNTCLVNFCSVHLVVVFLGSSLSLF